MDFLLGRHDVSVTSEDSEVLSAFFARRAEYADLSERYGLPTAADLQRSSAAVEEGRECSGILSEVSRILKADVAGH